MSFFKNIWRTNSKHKKLSEEWALAKSIRDITEVDEINSGNNDGDDLTESENIEDATFHLKYIGSTLVDRETNQTTTAEAIKTILRVAKATGKKLPKVNVTVSLKGIQIQDEQSDKNNEISIYKISYCSADAAHSRVFAFIAANNNDNMECYAFLCAKRKQAQAVTLSVGRSFSMAYEAWRMLPSSATSSTGTNKLVANNQHDNIYNHHDNINDEDNNDAPLQQLIDFTDFDQTNQQSYTFSSKLQKNNNQWVSFDDENDSQRWTNNQQIDFIYS